MLQKTIITTFLLICTVFANKEPEANPSSLNEHRETEHPSDLHLKGEYEQNEESRIVQEVYSPDYYEPNIILDYRYLKTGGRRYTRGDGGQILILPRRNGIPIAYNDYDTLLEYLRLRRQADMNRILMDGRRKHKNGFEQHLDTTPGHYEVIEGHEEHENPHWQHNMHGMHRGPSQDQNA